MNTRKGFTLVELLVVIAILAILATVSVVGYTSFIDRANQSTAMQELTQIRDSVIAEDILNPNFSIAANGTITVTNDTDATYSNLSVYLTALAGEIGANRTCEVSGNTIVYKNTEKKVTATWDATTGTITTGKLS